MFIDRFLSRAAAKDSSDAESPIACITFTPTGEIVNANAAFLRVMGYSLPQLAGQHHRIFVTEGEQNSPEYARFWSDLALGRPQEGEFRRLRRDASTVWLHGCYCPERDASGKVTSVRKFAFDITAYKAAALEAAATLAAIDSSMGSIEFDLQGNILRANRNFLDAMGYAESEVLGRHHSMFIEPAYAQSADYKRFWQMLRDGEFQAAQYKRLGKSGREVWIEASYNPIKNADGQTFKVVKFATVITPQIAAMNGVISNVDEIEVALQRVGQVAESTLKGANDSNQNISTVAAAIEEMNASVGEISSSMKHSLEAVSGAISQTKIADTSAAKLSDAAHAMNGIVDTISAIAKQINLLALNATIEAARAGDAGKGFAVVAGEVKTLARQAAEATAKIGGEIAAIQHVSLDVASSLGSIRESVQSLEHYVATTASAVEEQNAVTRDISQSMQFAATASAEITANMHEVNTAVETTGTLVNRARSAAASLKK